MKSTFTVRSVRRAAVLAALCFVAGLAGASAPGAPQDSPDTSNDLGFSYVVGSAGGVSTLDIRMAPNKDFDAVVAEAGSGVASLTPPCQLTALVAGGHYSCHVELTGTTDHPGMTLNVVARRQTAGAPVPEVEIHHVSLSNGSYAPAAKPRSKQHHQLPASASH